MKLSLNWLNDYIKTDLAIDELSELLTDIGLEVEGIEEVQSVKGGLKDLVIGEVLTREKHENADRLNVCTVNIGQNEPLQIVCGAPNVDAGQRVIVAPVGSKVHPLEGDSFDIKKAKIRGVASFGMICAEDEIGLGKSHDGILVLEENAPVGQLAAEYFNVETDLVIEIGLTPNRSDANSHIGTARDLAAAIAVQKQKEIQVQYPDTSNFTVEDQSHSIQVEVLDADACPRYTGIVLSNVTIQPSPKWMQDRLKSIGVKTINNIVDITNFINHEYGQPLHAFDYDQIGGKKVIVQKLKEGSKFTTLDNVERSLSDDDLMICDENGGMCIAGVYGGLNSGVTDKTTTIFLESAYFEPKTIRRTELRHGLRTDAAQKFEKGIDPTLQVEVLKRAALLIKEYAGANVSSEIIDIQAKKMEPKQIEVSFKRLNQLTGIKFEENQAIDILEKLDFEILTQNKETVLVKAPLYRADVYREADVIEEVLRIYGFNNVPLSGTAHFSLSYETNPIDEFRNRIANHLSGSGLNEIMTNSITRSTYYSDVEFINPEHIVRPLNSLNAHLDIMRPDMLLTGLEAISHNVKRGHSNCAFYDFGKTYQRNGNDFSESSHLAIYLTGLKEGQSWLSEQKNVSFFDLKKKVEEVLLKSGFLTWKEAEANHPFLEEGLTLSIKKKPVATFGIVKSEISKKVELNQTIFYADIDFEALYSNYLNKTISYKALPKFPSIQRDLALVVDKEISYKQIRQGANQKGGKYLQSINLFNVFESEEKLGAGKKSYAVSFTFMNEEATLTNKQIDKPMNQLIQYFEKELNAIIRT